MHKLIASAHTSLENAHINGADMHVANWIEHSAIGMRLAQATRGEYNRDEWKREKPNRYQYSPFVSFYLLDDDPRLAPFYHNRTIQVIGLTWYSTARDIIQILNNYELSDDDKEHLERLLEIREQVLFGDAFRQSSDFKWRVQTEIFNRRIK